MLQTPTIRKIKESDCQQISVAFQAQGWDKPIEQYERYCREQENGIRTVLIAFCADKFAGYLTIVHRSDYPPFAESSIPEIVDLNVLIKFQRRRIGSKLLDAAEKLISQISDIAGIGVGLFSDYGNAQRLYVKRGYTPDGRGICRDGIQLKYGDEVIINDDIALYFTKKLN